MPIHCLVAQAVEKPWGRTDIPPHVAASDGSSIGEVWFLPVQGIDLPLLVKYIFTSEKLSVQVHPNDEQARQYGLAGGKSECWYVLDAAPDARLGIGLCQDLTSEELSVAALDGSIEALMEWKPVHPGSFYYIPAGTVHAIGGGVALVEIQQNNDVTYRLYDYGRPREFAQPGAARITEYIVRWQRDCRKPDHRPTLRPARSCDRPGLGRCLRQSKRPNLAHSPGGAADRPLR